MPRAPLLPDVADGLGSMPPGEALLVSLKLITSLVAGVSFLGFSLDRAHPVNRVAAEMTGWVSQSATGPEGAIGSRDQIIALLERIGFQIWSLAAFQEDEQVRASLLELIEPVCQAPVELMSTAGHC